MKLSKYDPNNRVEITQLFTKTFSDSEGVSEGELIGNLVHDLINSPDNHDILGFVASEQGRIIACIFFSRLTFENGLNAFLLAPVAVHTDHQGKGVGQALINYGLRVLRGEGVKVVFTYGDINFYCRVGFHHIDQSIAKSPLKLSYPKGWLAQSLISEQIELIAGNSYCVDAFNKPEYW